MRFTLVVVGWVWYLFWGFFLTEFYYSLPFFLFASTLIVGLFGWLFQNFFLSNKRSGVFLFLFRGSGVYFSYSLFLGGVMTAILS